MIFEDLGHFREWRGAIYVYGFLHGHELISGAEVLNSSTLAACLCSLAGRVMDYDP